jgi:murein DD-endopeptidase MepM/ murein hydrolase activator NlpD
MRAAVKTPRGSRLSPVPVLGLFLSLSLATVACEGRTLPTQMVLETCGPYPPIASSPYVLPIPVGTSTFISQSNCGQYTHAGSSRYAVDFHLEVGRVIVAARGGQVTEIREHMQDNVDLSFNQANYVEILHADGTVGWYGHLMHDGVMVEVGDTVAQGQPIAYAGNTGFTGNFPHLHLVVYGCMEGCESIAVVFRNADPPAPNGLQAGATYTALPY